MGRDVDGMNAEVRKDLNVHRNEELMQMSIQDTVEKIASSHNSSSLGWLGKEKMSVVLE